MSADEYQRHGRAFGYTAPPFGCFDPDLPYSYHTHIDDGHKTQLAVRPTNRITVLCNRCKPNQNNVQSRYGVGPVVNIFQIKTLASLFNICLHLQITVLIFPSQSVLHFQFWDFLVVFVPQHNRPFLLFLTHTCQLRFHQLPLFLFFLSASS